MFQITSISLQCLCWVLKFNLPSLQTRLEDITESVFKLLHKYAAAGLSKGDNFDLVMAAFKVNIELNEWMKKALLFIQINKRTW